MGIKLANNAASALAFGVAPGDSSITVAVGTGARFPAITGADYFYVTVISAGGTLEIMKCTARVDDVLTVSRAQDDTTAKTFLVGDRVEMRVTVQVLREFILDVVSGP